MMELEFQIPLAKDDLQVEKDGSYFVRRIYDAGCIKNSLEECKSTFRNEGSMAILSQFDVLYSCIDKFSRLDKQLCENYFQVILSGFSQHQSELSLILQEEQLDQEECRKHLNILKMEAYILTQFMDAMENQSVREDATDPQKSKGKAKKKTGAGSSLKWDSQQDNAINTILQMLNLDIHKLWSPPIPDEEFVNLFTGICYKLLENQSVVKLKETKEGIFHILGICIKKFNHGLGATLKIIQLLQQYEHVVPHLAQAVEMFANEYGGKVIVSEILREIGRMDSADLSKDTSGTRSFSLFVAELADRLPSLVLTNISLLLNHLEGESYSMRNGVLSTIGEIVLKVLSKEDLGENHKATRDKLLDKLEEHLHDVHAFVRSRCLQIWLTLCNEKAIPLLRYQSLLDIVIGRLHDKSSIVRRHAIQLLKGLLCANPFGAELRLEILMASHEKEKEKLKAIMPEYEDSASQSQHEKSQNELDESMNESTVNESHTEQTMQTEHEENLENAQNNDEVTQQRVLVRYLEDCCNFARQMQLRAVPVLNQLLGSKTTSDVLEAIQFFITAYKFGLTNAFEGIKKMLSLIWSTDAAVKQAVVDVYKDLYIDNATTNGTLNAVTIVRNLSNLCMGASQGMLTSMQELIGKFMKDKLIPSSVIQLLWQRFSMKVPQTTEEESRAALVIVGMLASVQPEIVKSNIDVLVSCGLGPRALEDSRLALETCKVLLKYNCKQGIRNADEDPFRFDPNHEIFNSLKDILYETIAKKEVSVWIPLAERAIDLIYTLSEHPDSVCSEIIKRLHMIVIESMKSSDHEEMATDDVTQQEQTIKKEVSVENGDNDEIAIPIQEKDITETISECHPLLIARFLSIIGHTAFKQMVHLDTSVFSELKRRRRIQEENKETNKQNKSARDNRRRSKIESASTTKSVANSANESMAEDEMGVGGAAAEDAEAEFIRKVCESEIVTGDNLLAKFGPLIIAICSSPTKYPNVYLRTAASLTLSKFMLVSSKFCDEKLQLLFTLLEKSEHSIIRANLVVALGDLTLRFPNSIEPWTPRIYAKLTDESVRVRQTTVTILSHLILNDMIKVKGQISEMAICLEDEQKRIVDLSRMFFAELARKGNALYNILPDIISRLSDPEHGIDETKFRSIMKYLIQFIKNDKQTESLVEKLCHRYRATRTDRQWHDLSYCLSLITYNEKCIRKLQDNIACYQDKLADPDVYSCFTTILSKAKKFIKLDAKAALEEFEGRLNELHSKGVEDGDTYDKASQACNGVTSQREVLKKVNGTNRKAKSKSRKQVSRLKSSISDESETEKENSTPTAQRKDTQKMLQGRRRHQRNGKAKSQVRRLRETSSSEEESDDVGVFT